MNKFLEVKYFKHILSVVCMFIIITGVLLNTRGKQEDSVWNNDYRMYVNALNNAKEEDYAKSILALNDLSKKYNSATLYWALGSMKATVKNYSEAAEYYETARTIYPAIVVNYNYLKDNGRVLLKTNDYSRAKRYFERMQLLAKDQKDKDWVNSNLEYINRILSN